MKSLEELKVIRERMQDQVGLRSENGKDFPILDGGFRKHVLVCGGTGCTSSGSLKLIEKLEEELKNEKANLYDKLNKIGKMRDFLEEHKDSWTIKDDKIHFTNVNRMTEYYGIFNQVID